MKHKERKLINKTNKEAKGKKLEAVYSKIKTFKSKEIFKLEQAGLSKQSIVNIYKGRYPWLDTL